MENNSTKPVKYPFTFIQEDDLHQLWLSFLHKQAGQLGFYVLLDEEVDIETMKKAVNIEIERNDCLRLRFTNFLFKYQQYFIPEYRLDDISYSDFRGKTDEDLDNFFKSDISVPLRFKKGETFRIKFFHSPDGRFGIYICAMHLIMDAAAFFIMLRDLLFVYSALKNSTELPKPLSTFEEGLKRDFEIHNNKAKFEKNDKFFREYFSEKVPDFYAGIDGMREIYRIRKKKHNPNVNYIFSIDPFHDKSETVKFHLDKELSDRIDAFCAERRVTVQALLQLGLRTHLSKINEYTDDVSIMLTINRRQTLADINSCGTRALALPVRTVIDKGTSFSDALTYYNSTQMKIFKHCDYPSIKFAEVSAKINHRPFGTLTTSMLFTYFPKEMFVLPEGMKCDFGGISPGYFTCAGYCMVVPNFREGGLDCYYEHQVYRSNAEDVEKMHINMIKTIEAGLENPDITIGEILSDVL